MCGASKAPVTTGLVSARLDETCGLTSYGCLNLGCGCWAMRGSYAEGSDFEVTPT
jgi:hypothetical protein